MGDLRVGSSTESTPARVIPPFVLLSWMGMIIHDRIELPGLPYSRPEYVIPSLISLGLLIAWRWDSRRRRAWAWLLLGWASLHLVVGGLLSVLPLSIWPFSPEQSVGHYLSHVIYSVCQIPLIWKLTADLIRKESYP